jgi:hypothetical protein
VKRGLLAAVVVVVATLAPAPPALGARPYLGVYGTRGPVFTEATHPIKHVIAAWGQGPVRNILGALGPTPMLGMNPGAMSSQALAQGRGDAWLAEINREIAALGAPRVYVRPMAEMNGHWHTYCAFNQNGSARPLAYSTAWFRKAFARIAIVLRGGPLVNAALTRLGLPPALMPLEANPRSRIRMVWNPHGYSTPNVPGNRPRAYYPGDAYVDVVGADVYKLDSNTGLLSGVEAIYKAFPGKPFAIPEWGIQSIDDAGFVQRIADFLRTHGRTELAVFFNGRGGGAFDIARKPKTRAAYQRLIVPLGRRT